VALLRTDVSEEHIASIIQVTRNVHSPPILVILMKEALIFSEKPVLTEATRPDVPEDAILQSHRRENPKSYIALTGSAL
jgi:hypothetical protein